MTDSYNFEQSLLSSENEPSKFSHRFVREHTDSNGQNYQASQLRFNLPSISTQDSFISLKESFISFPYTVHIKSTEDLTAERRLMATLKSGFQNLIASASLTIDNVQVFKSHELDNIPLTFKILSTASQDDLHNLADTLNFAVDNEQSINYVEAEGGERNGIVQESPHNDAGDTLETNVSNHAFLKRAAKTAYDPTLAQKSVFTSVANTIARKKSHVEITGNREVTYHMLVNLPLRFITVDLFEKMQLCKGLFMKLDLNIHSGTTSFVLTKATKAVTSYVSATKFGCMPVMIAEQAQTWDIATNTAPTITIACGIGKAGGSTVNPLQPSATFNAVMYKMRPEAEMQYLQSTPSKKIDFSVVDTNSVSNVVKGAAFRSLVSDSVSKRRWLLIHTSIAAATNGNELIQPLNSPFTSSPATLLKEGSISNLQILIGGSPLFEDPKTYTYDMFMNEIRGAKSLYGGLEMGLSSGLLDERMWSEGHGWIFIDLSRAENAAADVASKSVEVKGTNNGQMAMDVRFFLAHEETFTLNTSTGKVMIE